MQRSASPLLALVLSLATGLAASPAAAQQQFPAKLVGHAILPAYGMAVPPPDAPRDALVAGKFAGPDPAVRVDRPGTIMGRTGDGRATGISLPFVGQPVQGFSGIKPVGDGSYWVLTDNGFGNKRNSPDALLMVHRLRPDWEAGTVTVERTIFLSDPDRKVPFRIAYEGSSARYLTGADFDLESIQPVGDGFYIGDEFGPYLIRIDAQGRVVQLWETMIDGRPVRGPDHPAMAVPASPAATVPFQAQRSGGYEGMAAAPDGSRLYALLEKPLFGPEGKPEGRYLRIVEFDTGAGQWTGKVMSFALAEGATAIGDFNLIDERRALVIERDDGEGDASLVCPAGQGQPGCFRNPAKVKRITLVDLGAPDGEGFVKKLGYVDLLTIADPDGKARQRGDIKEAARSSFAFPFFTIENVARVDETHIIVGNDNNLPFSAGRFLGRADDNEFILLAVPELLQQR